LKQLIGLRFFSAHKKFQLHNLESFLQVKAAYVTKWLGLCQQMARVSVCESKTSTFSHQIDHPCGAEILIFG